MHFQNPKPQGKLITVIQGVVFDAIVDIRIGSPTFGKYEAYRLSKENKMQLYVPPDYAHGFMALTNDVLFMYKCTEVYIPENEKSLK